MSGDTSQEQPHTHGDDHDEPESTEASLLQEHWYHGTLSRELVHALLPEDGEFLVRRSKDPDMDKPCYVISVKFSGDYKHYTIQGEEGQWQFRGGFRSTIPQIIHELELNGDPVTSTSDVRLKKAVPLQDWELRHDDVQLHDLLGKGYYRETWRATLKREMTEVAVRVLSESISHEELRKKHLREASILLMLDNPNIVKFVGIAVLRQPFMIIMEYAPGGDLLTYLRNYSDYWYIKIQLKICMEVVRGLIYLEGKGIVHGNIAARNCLVGTNDVIKISNFSDCRPNAKWCAPEVLNEGELSLASDIWSFGILMWEICSKGSEPYPGMSDAEVRQRIEEGYRMPRPGQRVGWLYPVMKSCWEYQKQDRPNIQTLRRGILMDDRVVA